RKGNKMTLTLANTPDAKLVETHSSHANLIDSSSFDTANFQPHWLVEQILVENQLCTIGGPPKSLKTSIAIDLAISLGSGTPFLGRWKVPEKRKVAIISG